MGDLWAERMNDVTAERIGERMSNFVVKIISGDAEIKW
jgi:hypothetical protein